MSGGRGSWWSVVSFPLCLHFTLPTSLFTLRFGPLSHPTNVRQPPLSHIWERAGGEGRQRRAEFRIFPSSHFTLQLPLLILPTTKEKKEVSLLQSNTMANPDPTLAELRAAVAAATTPAERANALNQLAEALEKHSQYTESLAAAEEAYGLAQQVEAPAAESAALRLQGVVYARRGEYSEALRLFEQSQNLCEKIGDRSGVARVTGNIGLVYQNLGEYGKSLEYFTRALDEELDNRSHVANVTGNIGLVYQSRSEYGKSLEYYTRAIALHEEIGNRSGVIFPRKSQ